MISIQNRSTVTNSIIELCCILVPFTRKFPSSGVQCVLRKLLINCSTPTSPVTVAVTVMIFFPVCHSRSQICVLIEDYRKIYLSSYCSATEKIYVI